MQIGNETAAGHVGRFVRVVVHIAVLTWPIHFGWEMAQAYLYVPMGTVGEATWCLGA